MNNQTEPLTLRDNVIYVMANLQEMKDNNLDNEELLKQIKWTEKYCNNILKQLEN